MVKDVVMRQGTSAPHTEYRTLLPLEPLRLQSKLLYSNSSTGCTRSPVGSFSANTRFIQCVRRNWINGSALTPLTSRAVRTRRIIILSSRNLVSNTVRLQKAENVMPANRYNVQMLCTLSSPRRAGQRADRPHDSRPPSGALISIVSANPWTLKFERESGTPGRSKKHDNSGLGTLLAS
jgi:hypothetical protein